jgi:hypothetical protein
MNLELTVTAIVNQWANGVASTIQSKWANMAGIQGEAHATADSAWIEAGNVVAMIRGFGQKCWISEYGSGSAMDHNSPYFNEYIKSPEFNQWRLHSSRMPIMGRSEGEYKDLDGNTHKSSGKMAGFDLERDGKSEFQPMIPMHIIEEALKASESDLRTRLNEVIPQLIAQQLQIDFTVTL